MLLQDIKTPAKARLQEIFAQYPSKSMGVKEFGELLTDVGKAFMIPASFMFDIAEFEASYPHKPKLLRSDAYESSATYRGPMQIGPDNWVDTRKAYAKLGINVTSNRAQATLAQQVAGVMLYIVSYANAKGFESLKTQPLDSLTVYLIHNQGPGGARAVFSNKPIPGWLKANMRAQSGPVRNKISARYRISL